MYRYFATLTVFLALNALSESSVRNKRLVSLGILLLTVLHQDFWLWENATLMFGFLPAGLAYHAFYSIAIACFWVLIIRYAWPANHEIVSKSKNVPHEDLNR